MPPAIATAIIDPVSVAMFVLVGAGQIVTWVVMIRSGRSRDVKRGSEQAAYQATEAAAVADLAKANTRIATALEKLENWARTHDLDDSRRWATSDELFKQLAMTDSRMTTAIEGMQRQITNVALGIAPSSASEIPANRRS